MTKGLIETQAYKVERLAIRCARLRKGYNLVFCQQSKSRIGWDLLKAKKELTNEQKVYTQLCDQYVSSQELESYLKTQIQILS